MAVREGLTVYGVGTIDALRCKAVDFAKQLTSQFR